MELVLVAGRRAAVRWAAAPSSLAHHRPGKALPLLLKCPWRSHQALDAGEAALHAVMGGGLQFVAAEGVRVPRLRSESFTRYWRDSSITRTLVSYSTLASCRAQTQKCAHTPALGVTTTSCAQRSAADSR